MSPRPLLRVDMKFIGQVNILFKLFCSAKSYSKVHYKPYGKSLEQNRIYDKHYILLDEYIKVMTT